MRHEHASGGTGKLLFGLIAGGTIGAALALLYAPEKGTRLRARISRKSGELLDEAKGKVGEAVDAASETMDKMKNAGSRARNEALRAVDTASEKASKVLQGN